MRGPSLRPIAINIDAYQYPLNTITLYSLKNVSRHLKWRQKRSTVRSVFHKMRQLLNFRVIEHTIRCQNIRQRPGAVKLGHEKGLRLAVKQYLPESDRKPQPSDVTLIGAHANSFPKVRLLPYFLSFLASLHHRTESTSRNFTSLFGTTCMSGYAQKTGIYGQYG